MGRKRLRIILVGLPLFAERLEVDLKNFDPNLNVEAFNTYYSFIDKLKAFLLIPFADVVYSINGSLSQSRIFDWALLWNKKLMMTWVGTDVSVAKAENKPIQKYLEKAHHYCEVDWIKDELKELNIHAEILNFFNFKESQTSEFPNPEKAQLTVLSYLAKGKEVDYGLNQSLALADRFQDVQFNIIGSDGDGLPKPNNFNYLGWVENVKAEFDKSHVTARLINHDGLSGFVLESLLLEKYVLYSQPLNHCIQVNSTQSCVEAFQILYDEFKSGNLKPNSKGREYVLQSFSKEKILTDLIEEMSK